MTMFLRWWLLFCTSIAAMFIVHAFGFTQALLNNDMTRLSFVIIILFFGSSIFVGYETYKKWNQYSMVRYRDDAGIRYDRYRYRIYSNAG